MQSAFITSDDREESVIERRERERGENGKVENDENIPLIPNVDKDVRKTILHLEVHKVDPPNDGYRGVVPIQADREYIAKLYGNGVYEFRAVTETGKILRRAQGVKINVLTTTKDDAAPSQSVAGPDLTLLKWQADQSTQNAQRVESFGRMAVDTTRDMAKSHMDQQAKLHEQQVERDRAYYASQMQQQQQWFQQMMLQQQQMHVQAMERANNSNNLIVQVIQQSNERLQKLSDPTALLSVFQQGMMLASSNQNDDDEDDEETGEPWVKAIEAGAGAIKDIAGMARPTPAAAQAPAQKPVESSPSNSAEKPKKTKKRNGLFTKEELRLMVRAKHIMQQKGLDFTQTVNNALVYMTNGGAIGSSESEQADEDEPGDSDEPEEGDSEETESADMEDA